MDGEVDESTQPAGAVLPQSNFDVAMARCWAGIDAIMIDSSLFCGLEPHAITEVISAIEDAPDEGANQVRHNGDAASWRPEKHGGM